MNHPLLTIKAAARLLGVSTTFLYKRIKDGTLPHFRLGTEIRLDEAELCTYFRKDPCEK